MNELFRIKDNNLIGLTQEGYNTHSLVVPDGITHIGDEAFKYDEFLVSVELPNTVTYIEPEAF